MGCNITMNAYFVLFNGFWRRKTSIMVAVMCPHLDCSVLFTWLVLLMVGLVWKESLCHFASIELMCENTPLQIWTFGYHSVTTLHSFCHQRKERKRGSLGLFHTYCICGTWVCNCMHACLQLQIHFKGVMNCICFYLMFFVVHLYC